MVSLAKVKKRVESHSESREYLWLAGQLMEQGDLDEALLIVNRGLQYHDHDLVGFVLLANIKQARGDLDDAKDLWTHLLDQYPSMVRPIKGLFEIALETNNIEESRLYYEKLRAIDPFYIPKRDCEIVGSHPADDVGLPSLESDTLELSSCDENEKFNTEKFDNDIIEDTLVAIKSESSALEAHSMSSINAEETENLSNIEQATEGDTSLVDSTDVEGAFDDIFGDDDREDFVLPDTIDQESSEAIALKNPEEESSHKHDINHSVAEVIELPILDLIDDEDEELGFLTESTVEIVNDDESEEDVTHETRFSDELNLDSLIADKDNSTSQDDLVTGSDVSDALDEIFGHLEEDAFDEALLGASDSERVVPGQYSSETRVKDECTSQPSESMLVDPDTDAELDSLFVDADNNADPVDSSGESIFVSSEFDMDEDDVDRSKIFNPIEEVREDPADELIALDDHMSQPQAEQYFNLEGDEATSSSEPIPEFLSLGDEDDIDESIFEDPTASEAHDSSETPTVTLAEIYYEQELFSRSIAMYEELIAMESGNPSCVSRYQLRIKEIKNQMGAES